MLSKRYTYIKIIHSILSKGHQVEFFKEREKKILIQFCVRLHKDNINICD